VVNWLFFVVVLQAAAKKCTNIYNPRAGYAIVLLINRAPPVHNLAGVLSL